MNAADIILVAIIFIGAFHFLYGLFQGAITAGECLTDPLWPLPRRAYEALLAILVGPFSTTIMVWMVIRGHGRSE